MLTACTDHRDCHVTFAELVYRAKLEASWDLKGINNLGLLEPEELSASINRTFILKIEGSYGIATAPW